MFQNISFASKYMYYFKYEGQVNWMDIYPACAMNAKAVSISPLCVTGTRWKIRCNSVHFYPLIGMGPIGLVKGWFNFSSQKRLVKKCFYGSFLDALASLALGMRVQSTLCTHSRGHNVCLPRLGCKSHRRGWTCSSTWWTCPGSTNWQQTHVVSICSPTAAGSDCSW